MEGEREEEGGTMMALGALMVDAGVWVSVGKGGGVVSCARRLYSGLDCGGEEKLKER